MGNPTFFDSKFIDATETFQRATTHLNNVSGRFIGIRKMVMNTYFVFLVYTIPIIIKELILPYKTIWMWETWITPLCVSWTIRMTRYTNQLFNILGMLARFMLSIKRVEIFMEHPLIEDLDPGKIEDDPSITNAIELKNASMSYGFNAKSLWDLQGEFKKGKKIAIVGYSNSGKHSFINMLLKLYEQVDEEEEQSRIYKENQLFHNSKKWYDEYFADLENKERERTGDKKYIHPDRADPECRGDSFAIWSSFVNRIPDRPDTSKPQGKTEALESVEDSFVKVLGIELGNISPFELKRHCGYLSSRAMLYNGTILENIDFWGKYKDNKWQIVKTLHY